MTSRSTLQSAGPRIGLALALLCSALHAGDPISKAFGKAAKDAEKAVKAVSVTEVGDAKAALAASLDAYQAGDDDLPAAVENAVDAVTRAVARTNSAARSEALALADTGADLLDGLGAILPDDLRDGGGGSWDDFKLRTEALLCKTDAKLEALFAKFIKGAVKQAGKLGFDPNPRWRMRGHVDILGGVEGPLLVSLSPGASLAVDPDTSSQIVVEARFLTIEDNFLQTIGVDFRGLGDGTVEITEGDGNSLVGDPLTPDLDGVLIDNRLLTRSTPHPLRIELRDASEALLDEVIGSVPNSVATPNAILKQFNKRLKQEQAFAGKQLGAISKQASQGLKGLLKSQKQDLLTASATLEAGISTLRSSLGNDCFWLELAMRNPVNAAGQQLTKEELGDEAVDAEMLPDGQGAYTKALDKLDRKARAADTKRARLLTSFGVKADKQAKDVAVQLDVFPRMRPDQQGTLLDLQGSDFPVNVDPVPVVAALAHVEGATPPFELLIAGLAKQGVAATEMDVVEQPTGDTLVIGGLIIEGSGAFDVKAPLLGDLPVVGWLFRSQGTGKARRSLTVILRPDIVVEGET